ncbi:probable chitinase 2 isoform X2 [Cylas formicarius]|uniref:probable chitinase 2 isoform X2 n=1 Tax=Cylas formicarius TaxID=197179 RepID=UPI002958D9AA|nr:probable chitinase 2 isoform X2 [Cylas formicarius]
MPQGTVLGPILFTLYMNGIFSNLPKEGPTHGKVVVCYMGTWAVYRPGRGSFTIENLEPSLCTHIIYAFAGLNAKESVIRALDPWQDLTEDYGKGGYQRITKLKLRYPHLKVSLAIGGWNEGSVNYSKLAADPEKRTKFVTSAVEFIKKYKFDGLDLDWEFPSKRGGIPEDKLNFLLLTKELKAAFRKNNLLLTAAFGAGKDTIDVGYDVEGLSVYLDFIHMMCYDYHGAWDKKTGANAPLRSSDVLNIEYTLNYMLKLGAPPSKLVLGVPLYGRTFVLPEPVDETSKRKLKLGIISTNMGFQGPLTRESGFMGYNEICLELKNKTHPWTMYWDSESSTPFAVRKTQVITYDDERSIAEKVRFAIEKKLAGIMVWSVDTDDFQGDCIDSEEETFTNFPLLRALNKAIEITLEDIKNSVIQDKLNGIGGCCKESMSSILMVLVSALIVRQYV